jgi:pimeloyl-ACP methyl ester carboxylesterase
MNSALALLFGLLLVTTSCSHYSTVRVVRPGYDSSTPAGEIITHSLNRPPPPPLVQLGGLLDATSTAATVLQAHPNDAEALDDYNFAVGRIFEIIEDNGLEPWKAPLACPGADKVWNLSIKRDPRPQMNPSLFDILPADIFEFRGTLVVQRTLKDGLGSPLVVVSDDMRYPRNKPFQGGNIFYGMTGVMRFKGNQVTGEFLDPLAIENIELDGHIHPLAADFTAPVALALARQDHRRKELNGLFNPSEFEGKIRLARLQPYDPKKIPILCIHGLGDSQATWAPLIQTLRGDAFIRKNYQFWFFSYPTAYPYPLTASVLRRRLDEVSAYYPDHKKFVLIGHSMGGMISRTLITDSGTKLWDAFYDQPPEKMPFSWETRRIMSDALIFEHRNDISRVIFASASHRGSDVASNFLGRLGRRIIGDPNYMIEDGPTVLSLANSDSTGANLNRLPNSIDFLKPTNRFVTTLAEIPLVKGVPYHSIIGDRGRGGNLNHERPVSTDGIVPYWSSHIGGAKSELIIPSHHWTNQHPLGIAEVNRILHEHVKNP